MKMRGNSTAIRALGAMLAPLFLVLSLAAPSPDLHDHLHGDRTGEPKTTEHTCILTLILDGKLAGPVAAVTVSNWVSFQADPVIFLHEAPILGHSPYLVPFALAPPVIV